MRILVVSNLYPPYYIGGYELGCKDVVERLKARGHDIRVLTGIYGLEHPQLDGEVYRYLELDWHWGGQASIRKLPFPPKAELRIQRTLKRVFKSFKPEVIYVWNLMFLSTSLALQAERLAVPVFYFVSDKLWSSLSIDDPSNAFFSRNFPDPGPLVRGCLNVLRGCLKRLDLLFPGPLVFPRVHFVSEFLKQDALRQGKAVSHGEVIPWGIDIDLFREKPHRHGTKRLLYVGLISTGKGVVAAIEVMS